MGLLVVHERSVFLKSTRGDVRESLDGGLRKKLAVKGGKRALSRHRNAGTDGSDVEREGKVWYDRQGRQSAVRSRRETAVGLRRGLTVWLAWCLEAFSDGAEVGNGKNKNLAPGALGRR